MTFLPSGFIVMPTFWLNNPLESNVIHPRMRVIVRLFWNSLLLWIGIFMFTIPVEAINFRVSNRFSMCTWVLCFLPSMSVSSSTWLTELWVLYSSIYVGIEFWIIPVDNFCPRRQSRFMRYCLELLYGSWIHVVCLKRHILLSRSMWGIQFGLHAIILNLFNYPYLLSDLLAEDAFVFELDLLALDLFFFFFGFLVEVNCLHLAKLNAQTGSFVFLFKRYSLSWILWVGGCGFALNKWVNHALSHYKIQMVKQIAFSILQ